MTEENKVYELAEVLWNYNHMNQTIKPADVIIVLGSYDILVPERASELFSKNYAPIIVFTGAFGRFTKDIFKKSEAEVFADVARKLGVPDEKIIIENKSTNTGENILFAKKLIEEQGLEIKSCIVVTKPYMERRAYATFKRNWPDVEVLVTSPQFSLVEYLQKVSAPKDQVINSIVADTQRVKLYGENGLQIPQEIPGKVWSTWEQLVKLGYDKTTLK